VFTLPLLNFFASSIASFTSVTDSPSNDSNMPPPAPFEALKTTTPRLPCRFPFVFVYVVLFIGLFFRLLDDVNDIDALII
jgi:hypothetical protein